MLSKTSLELSLPHMEGVPVCHAFYVFFCVAVGK